MDNLNFETCNYFSFGPNTIFIYEKKNFLNILKKIFQGVFLTKVGYFYSQEIFKNQTISFFFFFLVITCKKNTWLVLIFEIILKK